MEKLPYNLADLERELAPYYISATDQDIEDMLAVVGEKDLPSLFRHIPEDIRFSSWGEDEGMDYSDLVLQMEKLVPKEHPPQKFCRPRSQTLPPTGFDFLPLFHPGPDHRLHPLSTRAQPRNPVVPLDVQFLPFHADRFRGGQCQFVRPGQLSF